MIDLPIEKRILLKQIAQHPGYRVLMLDIGDTICTQGELKLLRLDRSAGATVEQIVSAQEQARARRENLDGIQQEVRDQLMALEREAAEEDAAKAQDQEESVSEFRTDPEIREQRFEREVT